MVWRFWKRRRSATAVVDDEAPTGSAPPSTAEAPRLDDFVFEGQASAPPAETPPPAEDVRSVVRRKAGRRLAADVTPRTLTAGFEPVLVPSLREQGLVYRLAAELRAHAAPAESLDLWGAWLELCPDDAEARLACGRVWLTLGALEEAAEAFREARRCAPHDPVPLGALGYVAGCLGDWEAAVRHLTEAAALAPRDAELGARLAEAQDHAGLHDEARETRQRLESQRTH